MKKVVAAIQAGFILAIAPVAFAAGPVNLTGDVSLKYERDTVDGNPAVSGMMYSLKLKEEAGLRAGWALYARLGAQYATRPSLSDYSSDGAVYGPDRKSVIALDQFGVTRAVHKLTYKLGRQDLTVGATALLYSRPETNIGKKAFVDGLSVSGTVGDVDISAAIAKEDNPGYLDNRIYAVRAGYKLTPQLDWGITVGRYQDRLSGSTDHWAIDGTYELGNNSLAAEYTKSSSSSENKAYAVTWNHRFDDEAAFYITGFRVETNGDMGKQSDFDNDNRGFYYGITYKMSDTDDLELVYKDQRTISSGENNTKLEVTFTHAF